MDPVLAARYRALVLAGLARPGAPPWNPHGRCLVVDPARQRLGLLEDGRLVFEAVGAVVLGSSCGACINAGPGVSTRPDQVTISAINRNFPGRSGPGQMWLASPATVAASALAGRIVGA